MTGKQIRALTAGALLALPILGSVDAQAASSIRACDHATFRVALDVGHTAEVPGAISARGVPEYAFNLRLATELKEALVAAGFKNTALIVSSGGAVPSLHHRVQVANTMRADLFLSIHHDSVPERFLEIWYPDGQPHRFRDRFSGHSIFVSQANPHLAESLRFARLLGAELKASGLRYAAHYADPIMKERRRVLLDPEVGVYRFDELVVLKRTKMPAVLLEAGSIINRQEEVAMESVERRRVIVAAASAAIGRFCEPSVSAMQISRAAAGIPLPPERPSDIGPPQPALDRPTAPTPAHGSAEDQPAKPAGSSEGSACAPTATADPLAADERLAKLQEALSGLAARRADSRSPMATSEPVVAVSSISLDFLTGVKTTVFQDGTSVAEAFDRDAMRALAATRRTQE
jgi:N-acetylmuramoyl-L-alanine amidase